MKAERETANRPLVWDALHRVYVPSPEPFQLTHHVLDRSSETLELSAEVERWGDEMARRKDSAENKLYVQIAKALAGKLSKLESEVQRCLLIRVLQTKRTNRSFYHDMYPNYNGGR